MSGKLVGPMPVDEFLEEFVPDASNGAIMPAVSFAPVIDACQKVGARETDMYDPFVSSMHLALVGEEC